MSYDYITSKGVIVPDTANVKLEIENEYKNALGAQMSTNPSTPQGRLISTETDARMSVIRNNTKLANQINPNMASGLFLDAICAFLDIHRTGEVHSTINNVKLTGKPVTAIPKGAKAKTKFGDIFITNERVVLDTHGIAYVDFIAEKAGEVGCDIGELSFIESSILGWETVYNENRAIIGRNIESDELLRFRRNEMLASQGSATVEAIYSELNQLKSKGLHSCFVLENIKHSTEVIEGITLLPHSIWVCVYGGAEVDVAKALLNVKSGGCNWNGAQSVTVVEENSGVPYIVKYDLANTIPIKVFIDIKDGVLPDTEKSIKQSLIKYANGEIEGERGLIIGRSVSPFELSGAINLEHPTIFVRNIKISRDGNEAVSSEITIAKNEIAILDIDNIFITGG